MSPHNLNAHPQCAGRWFMAHHHGKPRSFETSLRDDETREHHHIPELKRAWLGVNLANKSKIGEVGKLPGKLMAIVFWHSQGVLLISYVPKGDVN